jgi:hypothetical protein
MMGIPFSTSPYPLQRGISAFYPPLEGVGGGLIALCFLLLNWFENIIGDLTTLNIRCKKIGPIIPANTVINAITTKEALNPKYPLIEYWMKNDLANPSKDV